MYRYTVIILLFVLLYSVVSGQGMKLYNSNIIIRDDGIGFYTEPGDYKFYYKSPVVNGSVNFSSLRSMVMSIDCEPGYGSYLQFTQGKQLSYNIYGERNGWFVIENYQRLPRLGINGNGDFVFDGQSDKKFGSERNYTPNMAGNDYVFAVGGAASGSTNKKGGDLIFQSGISTGNQTSNIIFRVCNPGQSGIQDNPVNIQTDVKDIMLTNSMRHDINASNNNYYSKSYIDSLFSTLTNIPVIESGTVNFNNTKKAIIHYTKTYELNPRIILTFSGVPPPNTNPYTADETESGFSVNFQNNVICKINWLVISR